MTLSQEKTLIGGRVYFIHTVQKGQTLYSISKAYGVDQQTILKENPGVDAAALREGQAIRIPQSGPRAVETAVLNRRDFYEHRVRRGQTVYSLSRRYEVPEEVIYYYNPWARAGIKTDQVLWIPRNRELMKTGPAPGTGGSFFYYTVKEKDTLYSLSQLYGVSVDDIVAANPVLKYGLKAGQIVSIPRPDASPADSLAVDAVLPSEEMPCLPAGEGRTYEVALLLPFFAGYKEEELLESNDTLAESGTYTPQQRMVGLRGRNFAEFYEGFLLAVDSLKRVGLSINLHVYDTERDQEIVGAIEKELTVLHPDLIIGPVYTENARSIGRLALSQQVNLVSPLSTNESLVADNNRLFQVVPSRIAEYKALAGYLGQYNDGRILIFRSADSLSQANTGRFRKEMLSFLSPDTAGSFVPPEEYLLNDENLKNLEKILSIDCDNIIVVFSESEPDVSRFISRLYTMKDKYPVQLFGLPAWQTWKTIELNYLHGLQLKLFTPFYMDFGSDRVRKFLKKCLATYGYEPYEISPSGYNFCLLGYDIGLYFLSALKQYGRNFQNCLGELRVETLLSSYQFGQSENGGFVNHDISFIRYNPDYTVEKINAEPVRTANRQD